MPFCRYAHVTKYIQIYFSTPVCNRCTHPPPKYNVCFRKAQTLESFSPYTAVPCIVSFGITTWLTNQLCCQKEEEAKPKFWNVQCQYPQCPKGGNCCFPPNCHSFVVLYSSKGNSSWVCSSIKDLCIKYFKIMLLVGLTLWIFYDRTGKECVENKGPSHHGLVCQHSFKKKKSFVFFCLMISFLLCSLVRSPNCHSNSPKYLSVTDTGYKRHSFLCILWNTVTEVKGALSSMYFLLLTPHQRRVLNKVTSQF